MSQDCYKISRDELLTFAKKIYEDACYSYLDLMDATCTRMVNDFLDGRKIEYSGILQGASDLLGGMYTTITVGGTAPPVMVGADHGIPNMEIGPNEANPGDSGLTLQFNNNTLRDDVILSTDDTLILRDESIHIREGS